MFSSLWLKDTFERVVFTALETLLAVLSADGFDVVNFSVTGAAVTIGIACLAALVKSMAAGGIGQTVSPASLAKDSRGI